MTDFFRIGVGLEIHMASRGNVPPADSERIPAEQAVAALRWILPDGVRGRTILLDMASALAGIAIMPRTRLDDARKIVERGLYEGKLHAFIFKHEGGGKGPETEEPKSRPREVVEDKTFIAIQLVTDESEPKPVPFKRYRIVLPDETVREGMLDQFGKAVVVGIDPGDCKVSFPDFDAADWKAA